MPNIHYGKSKDNLPLPQTMEVVVYTLNQHMPVYYRTLPGNTPDSRSLAIILADLKHAGFKNVVMITDSGYESIRNLEMYIDKGQPMIMGTKTGQKHVRKEIDKFSIFDHHPEKKKRKKKNPSEPPNEQSEPKKPGRPKGSKNKKTLEREKLLAAQGIIEKRGRSRPKGSKNKKTLEREAAVNPIK